MSITKWVIDPAHSEIQFKIKHLMITNVTGSFQAFSSVVETEGDDFSTAKIHFAAKAESITTGNEQRDNHLRSPDFFESAKYPEIVFDANGLIKKGNDEYDVEGSLSMHGVTKKVKLAVEAGGVVKDSYGQTKAGFSVTAKISRKDFGLTWNAATETGGVLVSDEVRISAEVQYIKQ